MHDYKIVNCGPIRLVPVFRWDLNKILKWLTPVQVYNAINLVIYKPVFFKLIKYNSFVEEQIDHRKMDNSNYDDQVLMGENMPDLSKIEEAIPLIIFNEEKRRRLLTNNYLIII